MFPLTRACAYAYTLVFAYLFPDVKRHTSAHMHIDVHVHRYTRPQITVHMYTHTFMHMLQLVHACGGNVGNYLSCLSFSPPVYMYKSTYSYVRY